MTVEMWELVAREHVRDTLARYNWAGDGGRLDELAATFCADGVLEIRGLQPLRGRSEIVAFLGSVTGKATIVRHNVTNVLFTEMTREQAHVSCYFSVVTQIGLDHIGRYRDTFVPDGDTWLIKHRKVSTDWAAPNSVMAGGRRSGLIRQDISEDALLAQEACFARAFADGDPAIARDLYQPDVVYVSPTVRLFGWPAQIDGVERTLEFIALTIGGCADIRYQALEHAITPAADTAFVRVQFDWTQGAERLRSTYVVMYRYCDGRISRQELYYDPSGALERLNAS